jgi:proteasome accessory factor A
MEAHDVLRLWGEALDALEAEPGGLIGRLDWVTKRYLLRAAGTDVNADARKKIDLRYHELGDGYLSWLEAEGLAPRLVTPEEAEAAIQTPPANSPAALRGRLIRQLADEGLPAVASWDQVRTTDAEGRRKVVSLADWRKARNR